MHKNALTFSYFTLFQVKVKGYFIHFYAYYKFFMNILHFYAKRDVIPKYINTKIPKMIL